MVFGTPLNILLLSCFSHFGFGADVSNDGVYHELYLGVIIFGTFMIS